MYNNGIYSGFSTWGTNQSTMDEPIYGNGFEDEHQVEPEFCTGCGELLASDEHSLCTVCVEYAKEVANYERVEVC